MNETTGRANPAAGCRVLVVDDSAFIRQLVASWLREGGHQVIEAADGADAMERFHRQPFQVVVSDLAMPVVGGLELLAFLRKQEMPPEVILLTGSHASDVQAAVQALRLGAHDYIVKDQAAADAVRRAVEAAADKWRLRAENVRLLRELRQLSLTDALTGVGNRRALDEALAREVARALRRGTDLSLVLLDIDRFKLVNDSLGHGAGDAVLAAFAGRLRQTAREYDQLFRYGGEEFAMLLGDTPLAGAIAVAARVVEATAAQPMRAGDRLVEVTCSAGVTALSAAETTSDPLLRRADSALYVAKQTGRNRLAVAAPPATGDDSRRSGSREDAASRGTTMAMGGAC